MTVQWRAGLPQEYHPHAIRHVRFERHKDVFAHAKKESEFGDVGERCFHRHEFTLTESRLDAEEYPSEVSVHRERVVTREPDLAEKTEIEY